MTWEYTGLQGVTMGYWRVTRGDKGLQGVTRSNPFGKILILWVFETDVFVVEKGLFAI